MNILTTENLKKIYEKQYQNIKAGAELALMFKVG